MNLLKLFTATALIFGIVSTSTAADYVIDKPGQHAYITFKASHLYHPSGKCRTTSGHANRHAVTHYLRRATMRCLRMF